MPLQGLSFSRVAAVLAGLAVQGELMAGGTPLTTTRIATGLTAPLYVTHAPGDYDRIFIVEQCGFIKIHKNGGVLATEFLDISGKTTCTGERGLLGLAFHPNYFGTTGPGLDEFFVNYTDLSGRTVVARYTVSGNPDVADVTEQILIRIDQPFPNHNGGWIAFGVDGYLYVATGDGGDFNDPGNRAQDITNEMLGKMLRIDVNGDDFPADSLRNYSIPPTNPFVGISGDDEIWAYGLRNPWRNSFDRLTHDLYIGDVGQDQREEIDFQPAVGGGGRNYGWRCMEGTRCTSLSGCTCNDSALTLPIHEYTHNAITLNSVTGGYVYRGCAIPDLNGTYFFSDYGRNQIWSLRYNGTSVTDHQERTLELAPDLGSIAAPASFGEDAYGELYICDIAGGEIFKIVPDGVPSACISVPAASTWGLVAASLMVMSTAAVLISRRVRA